MVMSRKMAVLPLALIVSSSIIYSMETPPKEKEWYEQADKILASRINEDGVSDLEMKLAYNSANPHLKGIVEHLKDPKRYNDPSFRSALFYGDPGTGKSTMAHAIARYANWDCVFKRPTDLQKGNRGEAAQNFRSLMDEVISRNAETVVVVDEANGLWENSESKNHDTAETGMEIWQWMNKLKAHNKVFLILIANRIFKMPIQIKSRIIDHMYKFTIPVSVDDKYKIFKGIGEFNNLTMTGANETAAKDMLKSHPKWTGRDYNGIIFSIKSYLRDIVNMEPRGEITAGTIKHIAQERDEREKEIQYYEKELSDSDRQDLYQMQNMWQNVLMQRLQKMAVLGRTPGITRATGNFIMEKATTQNQQRLAEEFLDTTQLKAEHAGTDLW